MARSIKRGRLMTMGVVMQAEKAADAVLSWESASEHEGGASSSVEDVNNSSPKGSGAACIIVEVGTVGTLGTACHS